MANIIVESPETQDKPAPMDPGSSLVSWVMGRVNRWRQYRDNSFAARWGEYYRLFRGRWSVHDKTRQSERSRIVTPALSQAIEMHVAELEEAAFGEAGWVDLQDDVTDEEKGDMQPIRARLLEDMHQDKVDDSIAGTFLNGALYGQLIGKVVVHTINRKVMGPVDPQTKKRKVINEPRVAVKLDPIPADEFVPDPAGRTIEEMLGCAHEVTKPTAWVKRMQARGIFRPEAHVERDGAPDQHQHNFHREDLEQSLTGEDAMFITEYHGLVPAHLLASVKNGRRSPLDAALEQEELRSGDETLVEAIVTIGNKATLLRAVENPFLMKDRSIVACQYEKVPGRFWGRGVAEKGYNPQKALDAEHRMRIDALAYISNPMMVADITSLPRNFDLRVHPGKLWVSQGVEPGKAVAPISFSGLDPNTFNQSGELERMVQMGTGAMDSATPIRMNKRNETATGTSLQAGTFVKRTKRSLRNITRNFIEPVVEKILWRYMQYAPTRYPRDFKFKIVAGMGIVAREVEQAQLTQLIGVLPEGSPAQLQVVKGIISNASVVNKAEIEQALDQMLQGPTPEQQKRQQLMEDLQLRALIAEVENKNAEVAERQSKVMLNIANAEAKMREGGMQESEFQIEVARLYKELEELTELRRQNDAALMTARANLIKARGGSGGNNEGE